MGYRGVAAADAILTPAGHLLFTEINGRISGASHLHAAIARCLGGSGLDGRLPLERGGWPVPSFGAAVERIDAAGLGLDRVSRTGVVLDHDMTAANGTVGACIVAEDVDGLRERERQLDALFATAGPGDR